jgi:hypothetical protein
MALEYRLTVAGETPPADLAERALPVPAESPAETAPVLRANLRESHGFTVTIRAGKNAYVSAESDRGLWEWEPETYVSVGFRVDKEADHEWAVVNMLSIVWRTLETGDEDAALVFNGDLLLLTRLDGVLVKHHRDGWWTSYPATNAVFPDEL